MSVASAKMPAALVSGIVCLMLGVGGGIFLAPFVDIGQKKEATGGEDPAADDGKAKTMPPTMPGGKAGGMPGAKGGGGGMPGAKGGGGGFGGGKGPSPKAQLAQLVTKLETLSKKPLAVELTADQKKNAKAILADIDAKDALSDEDAKAKLDQLLKLLEGQKATLEAAGYRWPGTPFSMPGEAPPNPFKEGDPAERLKSLRESLGK